jgi:hypothetical protein
VQLLTALGHQGLPLADAELVVGLETAGQLPEAGRRRRTGRSLAQGAGQKTTEPLAATHQVGATPLGLELQGLLQGFQPGFVEAWLGFGGCGLGLSWCHSRSASSL